jgi:hypothetical protein
MTLRLALAALTMIVLSVFAFWPQYLSTIRTAESYTHVHAVLGTCWLLLLVVQPLLDPLFARIQFFYLPPLPMPFLYQLPAFALSSVVLLVLSRSLPDDSPGCAGFRSFAIGTVVVLALYFVIPSTGTWRAFTDWFRALPIT